MTLATCSAEGRPAARIVYLRGFNDRGLAFYTNYDSRKGLELAQKPVRSTLLLLERGRTVRFDWKVASRTGFPRRNRMPTSQAVPSPIKLGAWASSQSGPLESSEALERRVEEFRQKFAGTNHSTSHLIGADIGWSLIAWSSGRVAPSRLHDRFVYELQADGRWSLGRINP